MSEWALKFSRALRARVGPRVHRNRSLLPFCTNFRDIRSFTILLRIPPTFTLPLDYVAATPWAAAAAAARRAPGGPSSFPADPHTEPSSLHQVHDA